MPMSADIAFMPRLSEFKTEKGRASIGAVNGACVCRACGPGDESRFVDRQESRPRTGEKRRV